MTTNGSVAEESYVCAGCNIEKPDSAYSYAVSKKSKGNQAYRFKKCRDCRNQIALARYRELADDARRMAILDALPSLGRVEDVMLRDELIEGIQNMLRKKSKYRNVTKTVQTLRMKRGQKPGE